MWRIGQVMVAVALGGLVACQPIGAAAPPSSLHSVWCVDRGYPADLALPVVVGPGTGLSGCPAGERQVKPQ